MKLYSNIFILFLGFLLGDAVSDAINGKMVKKIDETAQEIGSILDNSTNMAKEAIAKNNNGGTDTTETGTADTSE